METLRSRTVLLVDPSQDCRDLYGECLRAAGFATREADNADAALALAPGADVIVTGLRLLGPVDGAELVRRLRAQPATAATPIIVVTAWIRAEDRTRAMEAGCDAFFIKPCLPDVVLSQVVQAAARTTDRPDAVRAGRQRAVSVVDRAREEMRP